MCSWTIILCAACVVSGVFAGPVRDPCDGYQAKCKLTCANKGQRLTNSNCRKTTRVLDGVPTTETDIKCECTDPKVAEDSANRLCNEFFDACKLGCHSESLGSMANVQCRVKMVGETVSIDKQSSTCGCQEGTFMLL